MQKIVGVVVVLALLVALVLLLFLGGAFAPQEEPVLRGNAVAEREEPVAVPEPARPGRLQIFVADQETKSPIVDFEMRREPAPSANWLRNQSSDGRFELSGSLSRQMRVRVRADGYLPSHVDLLYANVPEDEAMEAFSFLLERGYEVAGTVLDDATGEPLKGAHVRAVATIDARDFEDYAPADPNAHVTQTDAAGTYAMTVTTDTPEGYLVAWAPGYAATIHEVKGSPKGKVALRLKPGAHKRFTLVQPDDSVGPMNFRLDQPQGGAATSPIPLAATSTPDASATLRFVAEGVYRVIIEVPNGGGEWGRAAVAVAHDEQESVTWVVDEFGGIFGTVKHFGTDDKIVVSLVDARYPFVPLYETAPDADGLFDFGFIPVGLYTILVSREGSDAEATEKKFNVTNGEWREVEVSMPKKKFSYEAPAAP